MSAAEVLALIMLAALAVYAVTGGADFGGGVWDLLARGPRAADQRVVIERAIAPVWEANHVWLIFVIVILFSAFPPAFAALGTRFHAPLVAALIGIVLRGSALVFRQYGGGHAGWGRLFAIASAATPFFLGVVLAGVTTGDWIGWFPLAVGALAIALGAYLAATYLTCETRSPELKTAFARRAVASWIAVAVLAAATAIAARVEAREFAARLAPGLMVVTGLLALAALIALRRQRFRFARALAAGQVTAIVVGWGLAHRPNLVAPDLTISGAAAPPVTLRLLLPVLAAGALIILPSLFWLMKVFKSRPE
jgi:cytochrome d ubiquinol oxidase subunit II